jgi:hypothetical protein
MTPDRWAVLKSLFDQALAVDEHDRGAFLAVACAGDESLRGSLVALLDHHEAGAPRIPTPSVLVSLANLAFCLHCYHARGTKAEKCGALSGIPDAADVVHDSGAPSYPKL